MDRLKNMSLRKYFFFLTAIYLVAALLLSMLCYELCDKAIDELGLYRNLDYESAKEFLVSISDTASLPFEFEMGSGNENQLFYYTVEPWYSILKLLRSVGPIILVVVALLLADAAFYKHKLKHSIEVLKNSTYQIQNRSLDFVIPNCGSDELGQLCSAFESMRQSLLESNRELWRQTEERKRLNAAFSHDLRNPVTVLKGSTKMAKLCINGEQISTPLLMDHLTRIESFTERIERYIETMSNVQRLEQLQPKLTTVDAVSLCADLNSALDFAAVESGKHLVFHGVSVSDILMLDKEMLFQVAENLTTNALRFAKQNVSITLSVGSGNLTLDVTDDGSGFSTEIMTSGIQPFQKTTEKTEHLGMGLYICKLLCEKHGGSLKLENSPNGAKVSAIFKI